MSKESCLTCIFSHAHHSNKNAIMCIVGGSVEGPFSKFKEACILWRPTVKESRRRDSSFSAKADIRANIAFKNFDSKKRHLSTFSVEWTKEMDIRLKDLFLNTINSVKEISDIMGLPRTEVSFRINQLRIKRIKTALNTHAGYIKPRKPSVAPPSTSNQKYPGIRCCKGQCCKHKYNCQHYYHWVEMNKPEENLINSIATCINYSFRDKNAMTANYKEYIGLDGDRNPDPIYYTDKPK